jgi:hypothetical protein
MMRRSRETGYIYPFEQRVNHEPLRMQVEFARFVPYFPETRKKFYIRAWRSIFENHAESV